MGQFKSKSQIRRFEIMEREGQLAPGTTELWKEQTGSVDQLPERLGVKKADRPRTSTPYQPQKNRVKGYS